MLAEELNNKWKPILEHPDLTPIKDVHRRNVTAALLENTERALRESGAHSQYLLSEAMTSTIPVNVVKGKSCLLKGCVTNTL